MVVDYMVFFFLFKPLNTVKGGNSLTLTIPPKIVERCLVFMENYPYPPK